jgi:flagellar protein FlaI
MAEQKIPHHLTRYLNENKKKGGIPPRHVKELTDDDRKLSSPNLVYPIGNLTYIHIDASNVTGDMYPKYNIILPRQVDEYLFETIEKKFAKDNAENKPPPTKKEKLALIDQYLDKICKLTNENLTYKNLEKASSISVNVNDFQSLKYYFKRKRIGLDLLEPYLTDPYLEDISMVGEGGSFVVHKMFGPLRVTQKLNNAEVEQMLVTMAEQFGKSISNAQPVIDARLPDGSRINIVFGEDISIRGTNLTIRRFAGIPISVTQLINYGTIDAQSAAYLWMLLNQGMSMFVCGETASGKTTTLTAVTSFINPLLKIVSIEDTPEITLPHKNWANEVTRDTGNTKSTITMQDLLKASLRQRPNYIIVGEIRGVEASVAFQAMQTGHPVMSTFHAGSVDSLTQRLVNDPINIPKSNIDNLNIVLIQGAVTGKSGRLERRVLSINEITGFDGNANSVIFSPIFSWDPETDTVNFTGRGTSTLFKDKLLMMRGMSSSDEIKLYDEMDQRKDILEHLIEKKVFNYYEVFEQLAMANEIGIEEYIRKAGI